VLFALKKHLTAKSAKKEDAKRRKETLQPANIFGRNSD
jgi:hypothetical protein